ncbi:MAG: PHP domain-containing protein [Clostridia bacterium]|nr:PHP domain-containing protein [Clostridia bacterium]
MIINSDWHIHSEYSFDASNTLSEIAESALSQGLCRVGIADHANYNDNKFLSDIKRSAEAVKAANEKYPHLVLGVEFTPIAKPEYDYAVLHNGSRDGYVPPEEGTPYPIELALTKEEMLSLGIRYAVGASHWRVDSPRAHVYQKDISVCAREWYRQQLFMATDERVTILGHPWYHPEHIWYEDFSVIPHSMHMDIGHALKENGKYIECNKGFFTDYVTTEKFRHQYADFLREMFEMGIKVTFGSDFHADFHDVRDLVEPYLKASGFKEGDICEVAEEDLWQ